MLKDIINSREVIIAGIGKYQQDFEYIFEEVNPQMYIAKDGKEEYQGRRCIELSKLKEEDINNRFIIICDVKGSEYEEKIKKIGTYENGKDYVYGEDLFELLDINVNALAAGRKIVFWGYSEFSTKKIEGVELLKSLTPYKVVDKEEIFEEVDALIGKEVGLREYYFIIVDDDYKTSYEMFLNNGLIEKKDFISYKSLMFEQGEQKPSAMMRKTVFSKSYKQANCDRPFSYAFLEASGKLNCCCVSRINKSYGDYSCMSYDEIWNSNVAKIFRLSVINKTYCFCNIDKCFLLNPYAEEAENERREDNPIIRKTPKLMQVCMDNSCNLHCLSCRKSVLVVDSEKSKNIEFWADRLLQTKWMDNAETIVMAGNGEVFFSKAYRKLLYNNINEKRKSIQILSNGTLFNEKEFARLVECYDEITVSISVDSLEKEMYEKLRAGAKYDTIITNLNMLSEKRKAGFIKKFEIFVVVQMENLYELPEFIQKCIQMNVDTVLLNPIHKGGIYTDESFKEVNLVKDNGELKDEVIEVFNNPIFKQKQVSMGWFKNRLGKSSENECCI